MTLQQRVFKVVLQEIRRNQNNQKKCGHEAASMSDIGVSIKIIHHVLHRGEFTTFIPIKNVYAVLYRLKDKGYIRFKKHSYQSTCVHLTDKGVEYVNHLKNRMAIR